MSGGHPGPNHAFRKLLLVGVLGAATVILHHFAVPTGAFDPSAMLALGFVILACFAIGELVEVVKLPHITGYLLAGLALGPSAAGIVGRWWDLGPLSEGVLSPGVTRQLSLFEGLALALIAITAGGELKLDALRKGVKAITGIFLGQTAAILVVLSGFVLLLSQPIPLLGRPEMAGLPLAQALVIGLAVASIGLATSPAATIAVMTGASARGPFTRLVLSTVVLKDVAVVVLFSVFMAVANSLGESGAAGAQGSLAQEILLHVVGSVLVGGAVGLLMGLYLKYVRTEILLFLLGLVFTTTWIADQFHMNAVLLFIAAGFTTANFSKEGDTLIHTVERLSTPVYVVFFTLVGASLHLDHLVRMAGLAMVLVALRAGALWLGTRTGAKLAGAPAVVERYGWMGFVSQAGVAIGLAGIVGENFGEAGAMLETLIIAGVAVHELAGPVLLKMGLTLAREVAQEPEPAREQGEVPEQRAQQLQPWAAPERGPDPWGPPPGSQSPKLNLHLSQVEGELQGLVRDLLQGPLEDLRSGADTYLRTLRREFLHHHRRTVRDIEGLTDPAEINASLEAALTRLADAWRTLVLDRAARHGRESHDLSGLVEAMDQLVDGVPERMVVPFEPDAHQRHPGDNALIRAARLGLTVRVHLGRLTHRAPTRDLRLHQLMSWYLFGLAPARLEGVGALLVSSEEHLLMRTRALFDDISSAFGESLALAREPNADAQSALRPLWALRKTMDDDFAVASQEVDHMVREGAIRAARILGELMQGIKADALVLGGPSLSHYQRRISSVFGERTAGLQVLGAGLTGARQTTAARWSALALELELVALEGRVRDTVEEHANFLGRMVRGRGHTQVVRVQVALQQLGERFEALVKGDLPGEPLARAIRTEADSFERLSREAIRTTRQLQQQLNAESSLSKLLDALLHEARSLTERYQIPTGPSLRGEWKVPPAVSSEEVPFRDAVVAFVETSMARGLLDLTREYSGKVDKLIATLDEVERVIAFNAELAGAEIDVHEGEAVPPEVRLMVSEMLLGPARRSAVRVDELVALSTHWSEQLHDGIREAVLRDLLRIRQLATEGKLSDLRLHLLRGRAEGRQLIDEAGSLVGQARAAWRQGEEQVRIALGQERLAQIRQFLGLAEPPQVLRFGPGAFDPPPAIEALPVVYRRLFSDHALDVSDLLIGREEELERARTVLTTQRPGALRSAAVVGEQGVGKGAVITSLVRSLDAAQVDRIVLREPATTEQVEGWFSASPGRVMVLDGFQWLFSQEPGGLAPLRRFVEGVVSDRGRTRWVVEAESSVWRLASRVVPVEDAFPEVIQLRPLSPEQLTAAVLAHHNMSGYSLRFEAEADIGWRVRHLLSRTTDREARRQEAWFATLYGVTEGRMHDALRLWMAAVDKVDETAGVVLVGPVLQPPLAALASLPDEVLLTLRQTLRQGWLTASSHGRLFRNETATSASHLARLAHWGLLEQRGDYFCLATNLVAPVRRELIHRGWES
ncbi:MAG: cation:proton antiporter [Deltaproteobacteria bacterium]|nr:cation:proton antiporter [Deltaproteobacteria bacterium]